MKPLLAARGFLPSAISSARSWAMRSRVYLYFASHQRGFPFWVIVACITAFWTLPFALKLTGKLQTLALLSVINLTFVTLYGSYYYGGVSSPFLPWLLTALLLGFFYLGERPVLVLGVFSVNIGGFYAAYVVRGSFPEYIPLSELTGVGIVSVVSATIYVSMMAIYYANVVTSQSVLVREAERHRATAARMRRRWRNRNAPTRRNPSSSPR